jgi:hypothetical protein
MITTLAVYAAVVVGLIALTRMAASHPAWFGETEEDWLRLNTAFFVIVAASVLGCLLLPLQYFVARRLERTSERFVRHLDHLCAELDTLHQELPPNVCLKPIGDESALALAWSSAMASRMHTASKLLFVVLQAVRSCWLWVPRWLRVAISLPLTVVWSFGTAYILGSGGEPLPSRIAREVSTWKWDADFGPITLWTGLAWSAALSAASLVCALLLVASLAAIACGAPSLATALDFRIFVEAVAGGRGTLELFEVSRPETAEPGHLTLERLRHSSLYDSPGAIRAVIAALAAFEGRTPDP